MKSFFEQVINGRKPPEEIELEEKKDEEAYQAISESSRSLELEGEPTAGISEPARLADFPLMLPASIVTKFRELVEEGLAATGGPSLQHLLMMEESSSNDWSTASLRFLQGTAASSPSPSPAAAATTASPPSCSTSSPGPSSQTRDLPSHPRSATTATTSETTTTTTTFTTTTTTATAAATATTAAAASGAWARGVSLDSFESFRRMIPSAPSPLGNLLPSRAPSLNLSQVLPDPSKLAATVLPDPAKVAEWHRGVLSRVQTTLRGSRQDIGWLRSDPALPPVIDGTDRFEEIAARIRNEHTLPDSYVYLLIPGMFSNYGSLYFLDTKKHLNKLGLTCHIAKIHSEASVETNAAALKQYVEELHWGTGKRVLLLGHSKGGVDAAAAMSLYWAEMRDKVAGLVLVQSPYGGTPLASDLLREGQVADVQARKILEILVQTLFKGGDLVSLEDITYERRRQFLKDHPLPEALPVVSFHSEASKAPAVLLELSRVTHADIPSQAPVVPFFPREQSVGQASSTATTPVAIHFPVTAAMAVMALHLEIRYGARSDGLVARDDAEVPGSVVVRLRQKMDHSGPVYASASSSGKDVDAPHLCEALLTLLVEHYNLS